jgi:Response regulators consisting of a CheY-like receiver domain and a winged-helix DNA-binding domain
MTEVMVIEDNAALRESIALELEMRGYKIITAADGRQALDYLFAAERAPDIVVSDISMPNLDGYKLLEMFREDARWQGTPFIFLTALSTPNFIRLGKELGVDDYLTKPFETEDLVVAIENKLRRTAQMQRASERKLDAIRQELMTIVSHELRTPLSSIFGGVEMLAENMTGCPMTYRGAC